MAVVVIKVKSAAVFVRGQRGHLRRRGRREKLPAIFGRGGGGGRGRLVVVPVLRPHASYTSDGGVESMTASELKREVMLDFFPSLLRCCCCLSPLLSRGLSSDCCYCSGLVRSPPVVAFLDERASKEALKLSRRENSCPKGTLLARSLDPNP